MESSGIIFFETPIQISNQVIVHALYYLVGNGLEINGLDTILNGKRQNVDCSRKQFLRDSSNKSFI